MPATFEKDKNGRWVLTGNPGVERAIEPEQTAAPAKPKAKAKPKGFLEKLSNDISYEAKQAMTHPGRSISRAIGNALPVALSPMVGPAMGNRALQQGTIGAASNAARVLLEATQKVRGKKAEYTKAGGAAIDSQEDALQRLLGNKAPSEMTTGELASYGVKSSTALNLAIGAGGTVLQGLKFVGPTATRLGAFLDAGKATTKVGAVARLAAGAAIEEAISTPLDDNRGGSAVSLINALAGRELMKDPVQPGMSISDAGLAAWAPNAALGGAIGIGALGVGSIAKARKGARAVAEAKATRSVLEEHGVIQSNPETGQTAFTGQALTGRQANAKLNEMFGLEPEQAPAAPAVETAPAAPVPAAPVEVPAAPVEVPAAPVEVPAGTAPKTDPWAPAAPDRKGVGFPDHYSPVQEWLRQREVAKTPDAANYDQWLEQNQQIRGIPSQQMEPGGAVQGPAPSASREVADPWAEEYDPALPEATTALQVYNQLDDDELAMVAAQPSPLEAANQLVSTRAHAEVNPQIRTSLTAAPAENVADPVVGTWRDQWQSANTGTLRDLAHPDNSPELFEKIQNLTGRDWQEFTKADIVDGLDLLHQDGITVLPNRLTGGQMLPTEDIRADPLRFQYKQNVDEQGQQLGNSLAGVEKWNPDMEGTVQVWEDPADGNTYVINGHNRLAAAQRMDVPSLRVDYITAAKPEEARMRGALTNIAEGSGTPFDAAKALKGMGITDEAQMKTMGLPLKSGVGKQGLALSKLPDNIFQDTVDGKMSMSKAIALGQSGLDEDGMQQAYKALQGRDMSDATWSEVLQQASSAPMARSTQIDLFGNTESMNLMAQKGQLAAAVKAELVSDKNLMKKVGRSADKLNEVGSTQIDATAAQEMGMDAQMLIGEFDAGKYAEGHPFSELLNQGAEEVAAGGKVRTIARRVKQQIAELGEQMPATAVEKAPVEEVAPPPPKRLTEADRVAARVELVKDAIAKGEVRPPTTPIPELFEDSGVDIPKVQRELEAGIVSDDAIQMLDDELRLRKAFAERDAEAALAHTAEVRDAAEYELLTFDEKQAHGTMPDLFSDDAVTVDAQIEPAAPVADALDPADIASLRDTTGLSPEEAAIFNEAADLLEAMDASTTKGLQAARDVLDKVAASEREFMPEGAAQSAREAAIERLNRSLEAPAAVRPPVDDAVAVDAQVVDAEKPASIADRFGELMRQMAESDAKIFRASGEYIAKAKKSIGELADMDLDDRAAYAREQRRQAFVDGDKKRLAEWKKEERRLEAERIKQTQARMDTTQSDMFGVGQYDTSTPLLNAVQEPPAPSPEFKLPDELAKSSPRYGMATVAFGSDLDRAAYILRDKSKASSGEGKLVLALTKQGYDIDQIRKHGQKVNDALKAEAKAATGSAAAPQQTLKLEVPAQQFDTTASSSTAPVKAKVEIPTTAYRKITAKTGQDRIQSAAESLRNWSTTPGTAPISMDEATRLVQAKGAILHPDAIPGLDMDEARNQRSMGRETPDVQAAYEEFYGLRRPGHLDVVKAAAVEQKLAIDNQMNQIRNQASKEGC